MQLDRLNKLCNDIDILRPNVKFEIFVVNKIHKLSANLDSPGSAWSLSNPIGLWYYGTKAKLRDFVQAFQIKIHLPRFLQQKKCQISTLSSGRWLLSSESCITFDEVVFALKLHPLNWRTPWQLLKKSLAIHHGAQEIHPNSTQISTQAFGGICPATTTKTQATPGLCGLHHFKNSSSSLESRRPGRHQNCTTAKGEGWKALSFKVIRKHIC